MRLRGVGPRLARSPREWVGLVAGPAVFAILWFYPADISAPAQGAIAVAGLMIVLWATEALDHAITGVLGLVLFWALGIAPVDQVVAGFATETPYFLLGAMVIGEMARRSGLARRMAYLVTARLGTSYRRLLLGFIVVDFLLTFVIPSGIARVTILATIALGAVEAFGLPQRSRVERGLLVVLTYGAGLFDKMIIAGAAAILARGIIEDVGGSRVLYSQWFVAFLPCSLLSVVLLWRVVLWLYPPEKEGLEGTDYVRGELLRMGPLSASEKRCVLYLGLAVTLWMSDFLHHTSPAHVGFAVAALALLPRLGVVSIKDLRRLNWGAIVFTGAALSMGRILAETQALKVLTGAFMPHLAASLGEPGSGVPGLYWTGFVYHLFLSSETAMLSTSLPVVLTAALDLKLNPLAIGMIWTFAASGKVFAYQSAVLLAGYSYGCFEARDLLKLGGVLTILEGLLLLLLVPLYWPAVGIPYR